MPKQPSSDFDQYLAGKSPVSEIYQRSQSSGPSQATDKTILAAAQEELSTTQARSTPKQSRNWYVPVALAASVFAAFGLVRFYSADTNIDPAQLASNSTQPMEETKPLPRPLVSATGKSSPERMLDIISVLVEQSKTKQAKEQFNAFVVLFPRYEIDYTQYPNLKSFEPTKQPSE